MGFGALCSISTAKYRALDASDKCTGYQITLVYVPRNHIFWPYTILCHVLTNQTPRFSHMTLEIEHFKPHSMISEDMYMHCQITV